MDTVESLGLKVEHLESVMNSLSAKIDIVSIAIGKLNGVFDQIKEDMLTIAQDIDNGR